MLLPRKQNLLLAKRRIIKPKRLLNWYKPREFQLLPYLAVYNGYRYVLIITPRRYGKDLTCLSLLIEKMYEVPGNYYYCFPRFNMGRRAIWDAITVDGKSYLSLFPEDLVISKDKTSMKIEMKNSHGTISTFQVLGLDKPEKIPGMNVHGMVLSEYKLFNPHSFEILQPIINNNPHCFCLINSTTYGRGHLWDLKESALKHKDFFYIYLTLDDTKHISVKQIEEDIRSGIISRDLAMQEYWCSWDMGIDGTYYGKDIEIMEMEERICDVPYDCTRPVYTVADIGRMTTILGFFQLLPPNRIHIIDSACIHRGGVKSAAHEILRKDYIYSKNSHFWPHDMKNEDFGADFSRIELANQLGIGNNINPIIPKIPIQDGIECVRKTIGRMYIDKTKCKDLLRALKLHGHIYDHTKQRYTSEPVKDWTRDWADMMRYLAVKALDLEKNQNNNYYKIEQCYQESLYKKANSFR